MARIPVYESRTRASSQGQQGLSVNYNAEMFGASIGRALNSFGEVAAQLEARKKETGRFDQLTTFSEFETQTKIGLEELKRDTSIEEAQFFERADAFYNDNEAAYLNRVPAEYQDEFKYRSSILKQGVVSEAYDFGNKQRDAYFTQKIGAELQKSEIELAANPKKLEEFRQRMIATIDATDLPEIQKDADKKRVQKQLEQLTFKDEIIQRKEQELLNPQGSSASAFIQALSGPESGGRFTASNAVKGSGGKGHFGRIQFSQGRLSEAKNAGVIPADMTPAQFLADEEAQKATELWHIADIDKHIQRRGYLGQGYNLNGLRAIAHLGGKGGLDKYIKSGGRYNPADANGTSLSMYYKKFSGAIDERRYADLDSNAAYSNLSLDERQALISAGEALAIDRYNTLVKEENENHAAKYNDLKLGIMDGRYDESHILEARKDWLVDYEEIDKANTILTEKRNKTNSLATGLSMLENGQAFTPSLLEHKNALNSLVGVDGEAQLQSRSAQYVQDVAIPLVTRAQAIPERMLAILAQQTLNSDGATAAFGYETLGALRRANQTIFDAQVPEKLQAELDAWEAQAAYTPTDKLAVRVQNRASTPEERQMQNMLKTESAKILKEIDIESDIVPSIRSWSDWMASGSVAPATYNAMSSDFSMLFEEEYLRYGGDQKAATLAATKRLSQVWGRNEVDGTAMMKMPPNLAGYPEIDGGYDWIKDEIAADLKAMNIEASSFKMVADQRTFKEVAAAKEAMANGGEPVYPSYRIIVTLPSGIVMPIIDEDRTGRPLYFNFPVTEERQAQIEESFWRKKEAANKAQMFNDAGITLYGAP